MRFTKEFKLECIRKYKSGERIDDPGGCTHSTFHHTVVRWVRIYDSVGEVGLEHRFKTKTWQDKLALIQRVMDGESLQSVSIDNAIEESLLSKWFKIYQESGIDGLKLDRRGRPPKMTKKPNTSSESKTKEELEKELEYLRAENEYLKKLNALVQKRKGRQPKKK
ncbi:MAG: helix-turn-helix domain-containing protein [Bacilli bacterium]|nr:helix-turn-helix domain-containing protein [Bacilli bacterium]